MGLATVFGIVQQTAGGIVVDSNIDRGTKFQIYLPFSSEESSKVTTSESAPRQRTGGVILLAEDDSSLRKVIVTVLEMAEFTALAEEGLALARGYCGSIALLLTDVIMPKMNGMPLAQALVAELGPLPVLYMSGYTDESIDPHGCWSKA